MKCEQTKIDFLDYKMDTQALKSARAKYAKNLQSTLDNAVEILSLLPEVQRIILFGSYLAGRRDLFTDIDLLVIIDNSDQGFVERNAGYYHQLQPDADLDLLVYTPIEFEQLHKKGFLKFALEKSEVLYERK